MSTSNPFSHSQPADCTMVLLVDDQPFVAEVLRRALASEPSLFLHYCSDPTEAVEIANRIRPTVILQDLVMPGVDGLAIVARFRANAATRDTPIIVLSSKEDAQTKSLAFSVGANDYLVKLPDQLELLARVRYHSAACLSRIQRDDAFRALRESQQQLLESNTALLATNQKLGEALSQVKELRGLLPICSYCKSVRNDGQYWSQIEVYLREHSDLQLSHGVCDTCYTAQMATLTQEMATAKAQTESKRPGLTVRLDDTPEAPEAPEAPDAPQ
jgi:DNA-binding response OmpR family regulator